MFKVEIKNLKTKAKIGITLQERKKFQTLLVTICFQYKINNIKLLDDIKYLKDYSSIIKFLRLFIQNSKYKSLERLTSECVSVIEKQYGIKKAFVSINKIDVAKRYQCESINVSK
tara:strand:- start:806 stop:1150 length:345 start_codon:yes stop_codon:yes gene_type:complete